MGIVFMVNKFLVANMDSNDPSMSIKVNKKSIRSFFTLLLLLLVYFIGLHSITMAVQSLSAKVIHSLLLLW